MCTQPFCLLPCPIHARLRQDLERAKKVTVTFLTNIMLREKVSLPTQTQELFLTTFNDKVCTPSPPPIPCCGVVWSAITPLSSNHTHTHTYTQLAEYVNKATSAEIRPVLDAMRDPVVCALVANEERRISADDAAAVLCPVVVSVLHSCTAETRGHLADYAVDCSAWLAECAQASAPNFHGDMNEFSHTVWEGATTFF